MSRKERSRQKVMNFIDELDQGTASLTDEEFAMLKRMVEERRGRDAARVTVTPIDTTQPCSPRSRSLAKIAVGRQADSEIITPSTASNTVFLQPSRKPKDEKTSSEENKQFDPGGKGEEPPPWKAGVSVLFSFSRGNSGPGCPLLVSCAFLLVCLLCIVLIR